MDQNRLEKDNVLRIGGVSSTELAKICGTPLYVYDEALIEDKLKSYQTHFKSNLFDTEIIYASKAFSCGAMLRLLKNNGFSLDVVSGGELYLAESEGFPMERVYFHGNNKISEELEMALNYGCKTIVVDHLMECDRLISLAERKKKEVHAIIRINPGVTAHTHKYIITGDMDSKFGVSIQSEETILGMIIRMKASKYVIFDGFHAHIGSQIFDLRAYDTLIERMMKLFKKLQEMHKIEIGCLNLGGGFGVRYTDQDQPKTVKDVCENLIRKCESEMAEKGIRLKKLMIEPGRSVIAEAGCTLYKVGDLKETPNRSYLFVDGGMTDNIRVALYEAKYDCDLANKMDQVRNRKYTIAGKCCESGDILIENAMLPEVKANDLIVVYGTGAYGYSMASNYNRMNKPAVVFAKDGKAHIVIKRESYSDQLRFETDEEVFA